MNSTIVQISTPTPHPCMNDSTTFEVTWSNLVRAGSVDVLYARLEEFSICST